MQSETMPSLPNWHPDWLAAQSFEETVTLILSNPASDFKPLEEVIGRVRELAKLRHAEGDFDGLRFLNWVADQMAAGSKFYAAAKVRRRYTGEQYVTVVVARSEVDLDRVQPGDPGVTMLGRGNSFTEACSTLLRAEG